MKRIISTLILAMLLIFGTTVPAAAADAPFSLEAPQNLTAELKYDPEGVPYFELKAQVPDSVKSMNQKILDEGGPGSGYACQYITIQFDYKYGNNDWNQGESLYWSTDVAVAEFLDNGCVFEFKPFASEDDQGAKTVKSEVYNFRAYFHTIWGYEGDWMDKDLNSGYSNIATIGNPAYYSGASAWAVSELDAAENYGLITERIKDNMAGKITREEFAEIAVKLYEKYTGKAAEAGSVSFSDTTNPEILKAANLGLVTGVGQGKFAPNELVTREQMATILLRALKVINPSADFSTSGAAKFADDGKIQAWAKDGVYYCSKADIVKGMGNGLYEPKGNATREVAVIVCKRAYEFFKQ